MPGVGLEPTCLSAENFKSSAATNYATRAFILLTEATARIELAHRDFADLRITTFLRGLLTCYILYIPGDFVYLLSVLLALVYGEVEKGKGAHAGFASEEFTKLRPHSLGEV